MPRFNIRVYGILQNEKQQVLVCDEIIRGQYYTKFPGGGLEFGEGTRECLVREFMEEVNLKIRVGDHIYTTDFYQKSAFHPDDQIISIYYEVHPLEEISIPLAEKPFDFPGHIRGEINESEIIRFRFLDKENFSPEMLSLPIDKVAFTVWKEQFH